MSNSVLGDSKSEADEEVVYGRTRYGPPISSYNSNDEKTYDATRKVKESVRNASQKKNEFLRKLQEIEQISVSKKVKEEQDEVDGTVHFSEDEYFQHKQSQDGLHQDLEIIEKELLKVMISYNECRSSVDKWALKNSFRFVWDIRQYPIGLVKGVW